jgi:hypothetical protein
VNRSRGPARTSGTNDWLHHAACTGGRAACRPSTPAAWNPRQGSTTLTGWRRGTRDACLRPRPYKDRLRAVDCVGRCRLLAAATPHGAGTGPHPKNRPDREVGPKDAAAVQGVKGHLQAGRTPHCHCSHAVHPQITHAHTACAPMRARDDGTLPTCTENDQGQSGTMVHACRCSPSTPCLAAGGHPAAPRCTLSRRPGTAPTVRRSGRLPGRPPSGRCKTKARHQAATALVMCVARTHAHADPTDPAGSSRPDSPAAGCRQMHSGCQLAATSLLLAGCPVGSQAATRGPSQLAHTHACNTLGRQCTHGNWCCNLPASAPLPALHSRISRRTPLRCTIAHPPG